MFDQTHWERSHCTQNTLLWRYSQLFITMCYNQPMSCLDLYNHLRINSSNVNKGLETPFDKKRSSRTQLMCLWSTRPPCSEVNLNCLNSDWLSVAGLAVYTMRRMAEMLSLCWRMSSVYTSIACSMRLLNVDTI